VKDYQAVVDAEWQIIYSKLEAIASTGAKVVLSRLPIGDLATQYFADRNIFCAGRVASDDLKRVVQAVGGAIQSTTSDIQAKHLGTCEIFDERQIGGERYNLFQGCPTAKTCTLLLRGGAEQFIAEVERSLHDAIMIVKRTIKNNHVVAGGGAVEVRECPLSAYVCSTVLLNLPWRLQMEISKYLRDQAHLIEGKQQLIISAFAKALEVIPRQLCDNAGIDATDVLNKLRMLHSRGDTWAGVNVEAEGVGDNMANFVWEPSLVKKNAFEASTEAACLVLSVDETVRNPQSQQQQQVRSIFTPPFPPIESDRRRCFFREVLQVAPADEEAEEVCLVAVAEVDEGAGGDFAITITYRLPKKGYMGNDIIVAFLTSHSAEPVSLLALKNVGAGQLCWDSSQAMCGVRLRDEIAESQGTAVSKPAPIL
jgi:hypothetical protein